MPLDFLLFPLLVELKEQCSGLAGGEKPFATLRVGGNAARLEDACRTSADLVLLSPGKPTAGRGGWAGGTLWVFGFNVEFGVPCGAALGGRM